MVKALSALLSMVSTDLVLDNGGSPPPQHGGAGAPHQPYGEPQHGGYAGGPTGYGGPPQGHPPRSSGKAVAALVLGIVGICLVWIPFIQWISLITGLLAVVLGFLAKKEIDESGGHISGMGMAVTGLVLGIIQLVLLLLVALFFAALIADISDEVGRGAVALLWP